MQTCHKPHVRIALLVVLWSVPALADTCKKERSAYGTVARYAANAIDASVELADVQAAVGTLQDAAKAVNACLPPIPQTRPSGGGYLVGNGVGSIQECEKELDALVAAKLLDCVAAWDFVAIEKYRAPLPARECTTLVPPFVQARDALRACHAKYRFNETTRVRTPLNVPVVKTHAKSDKTGAICFGTSNANADVFVSVDNGSRVRFSGGGGTVGIEKLALTEPHVVHVFSGLKEVATVPLDFKALKTNFVTLSQGWQVAAVGGTTCK